MGKPTDEQMQAYEADKLKNVPAFMTAFKICQILNSDCITNKDIDSVLAIVNR